MELDLIEQEFISGRFPSARFGWNVIIFGVDMSLSGKDILILGKGPTQGLGENSLTA